jgi:hypothetical protein
VAALREGCEAELRHLLESAVAQVNADLDAQRAESQTAPSEGPDQRMTEQFRGYGDQSE